MALEDFTTYTEEDPGADITVAANKITVVDLPNNVDAWVISDKGVDHFGATFEHLFKFMADGADNFARGGGCYNITNVVEDVKYWADTSAQAISFQIFDDSGKAYLTDNETADQDLNTSIAVSTQYWATFERTSETGVQIRIYDDSGRTSLIDTLAITITSGRRYRHIAPVVSHDSSGAIVHSCTIEDLDLQEAAPGLSIPIAMHHYKQIMGVN